MAGEARKGGKKGRKVGRNLVKCARYAAKHGQVGRKRRHTSHGNPTPIAVTLGDGALRDNVPLRVRREPSGYVVCLSYSFFRDVNVAEVCWRLGIPVLT